MAKISEDEVKHISDLSSLNLSSVEIKKFQKQLAGILSHIDELKKVKTEKVEPTSQTTGLVNISRKDIPDQTKSLTQEEALSNTIKTHNGYFVVGRLIDN